MRADWQRSERIPPVLSLVALVASIVSHLFLSSLPVKRRSRPFCLSYCKVLPDLLSYIRIFAFGFFIFSSAGRERDIGVSCFTFLANGVCVLLSGMLSTPIWGTFPH